MNNKDRCLAKKVIAARMVRMDTRRPGSSAMIFSPTRLKTVKRSGTLSGGETKTRPETAVSPMISPIKPPIDTILNEATAESVQILTPIEDSPLVKELSKQSLTQKGALRKMQNTTRQGMMKTKSKKSPGAGTFKFDDTYFFPKKPIRRPDGASLSQVYESKKQDLWGAIIKQQYLESEREKVTKKREKEQANEEFGKLLTAQLHDNERRKANADTGDEKMMREVEELSAKNHAVQVKRVQDARDRHKKFIENALEDIEIKRIRRQKELEDEMTGSAMLIEKTKYLIAQDEEKKEALKAAAKVEQDRLFEENLAAIEKRNQDKQDDWALVAKITREVEENWRREDERRKRELAHLESRADDGPAHEITRQIQKSFGATQNDMYAQFRTQENSLMRQLRLSEEADARRRAQLRGSGEISQSWDDMVSRLAKEREDERVRGIQFGKHAVRMDKEHWENEKVKREKQLEAAATYQSDLDGQLSILRNKSLSSLKETMNDREKNMNLSLIRKYNIS